MSAGFGESERFRHACETIVINAHSALFYSDRDLEIGSLLALTNSATQEEQECRVVYLGDDAEKGQRVGIEFVSSAPHFWGVELKQPIGCPPTGRVPSRAKLDFATREKRDSFNAAKLIL